MPNEDQDMTSRHTKEVSDALCYKDIAYLYNSAKMNYNSNVSDGLGDLLVRLFISAKDEKLEMDILELFIGSQFRLTNCGKYFEKLFFITNSRCRRKQIQLELLIDNIYNLINHSTNVLNVDNVKNLKNVSNLISSFKGYFSQLNTLFVNTQEDFKGDVEIGIIKEEEIDLVFTKLF